MLIHSLLSLSLYFTATPTQPHIHTYTRAHPLPTLPPLCLCYCCPSHYHLPVRGYRATSPPLPLPPLSTLSTNYLHVHHHVERTKTDKQTGEKPVFTQIKPSTRTYLFASSHPASSNCLPASLFSRRCCCPAPLSFSFFPFLFSFSSPSSSSYPTRGDDLSPLLCVCDFPSFLFFLFPPPLPGIGTLRSTVPMECTLFPLSAVSKENKQKRK